MENIIEYLEQLDLSEMEIKFYLKLLEIDEISIKELAQIIGVKRTNAYLHVDSLMEKGLVTKVIKGTKTKIASTGIESLEFIIKEKLTSVISLQEKFPEIVKQVDASVTKSIHTSLPTFKEVTEFEVKYYKGINGIKKIYQDALKARELRSYVKLVEIKNAFPDNVRLFSSAFKTNKELTVKEIFYESPFAEKEAKLLSKNNRYAYKFMPHGMNLTSEDILMYDDKVAIIHYRGKENTNSVVLQNKDYYNNSKEFFDAMWKMISEKNK